MIVGCMRTAAISLVKIVRIRARNACMVLNSVLDAIAIIPCHMQTHRHYSATQSVPLVLT